MKKSFKKVFVPHKEANPVPLFWHPISVLLFTILTLSFVFLFTHDDPLEPDSLLGDIRSGSIIAFTNTERKEQNLPELVENQTLVEAATRKAEDMAAKQYFAHYSPQGVSPWFWFSNSGYQYEKAGENLAVLFDDSKKVVHAWMNSPTHRANILKDGYTEIGIGTATGVYKGQKTTYVVQLFAKPKSDSTPVLFAFETSGKKSNPNLNVQGVEITNLSLQQLFTQPYIFFSIIFIFSLILLLSALIALLLFFIKHSHNKAIVKRSVLYIFISLASLIYLYVFIFKNIVIL